jgi:outer membrane protein assembly factor BamA
MRNQFFFALVANKYLRGEQYRVRPKIVCTKFPTKFYGTGNDTDLKDEEMYTPVYIKSEILFETLVINNLYAGVLVAPGYIDISRSQETPLLKNYYRGMKTDGPTAGAGFNLSRDTRDSNLYPRKGSLTDVSYTYFDGDFFGTYRFGRFIADHRMYFSGPIGSVFAWQGYVEAVNGRPPVFFMPQLGGQNLLRGYYQGRYADKIYAAAQCEARVPVFWRTGLVLFCGIGNVYPDLKAVNADNIKYAGGAGLRIALNTDRMINFRIDAGFSTDGPNVYFNLLEAF